MNPSAHQRDLNVLTGIALKVLSIAVFVAMQSCIKMAGQLPAGQIAFFRSFFAFLPLIAFLTWRGDMRTAFSTTRPGSHIFRGAVGATSMLLGFFALTRLPLPEAIALNYAQPLLLVIISAVFLGETIRVYRWSAVVIGLVGVFIISWPKLTLFTSGGAMSNQEAMGVGAALVAAALSAVALLQVRGLVQTEKSATVVIWFTLTATVTSLLTLPFGWEPLNCSQAAFLIGCGICGGIAQILMTESYRHASASTLAPFEYVSLLLGVVVGYLVFAEVPTSHMIVGGLIVIGAGLFIVIRERRLGLERSAARKVTQQQ